MVSGEGRMTHWRHSRPDLRTWGVYSITGQALRRRREKQRKNMYKEEEEDEEEEKEKEKN